MPGTSKIDRVIELTASPAAQGYIDLWAQFFLLDHGSRLGRTITAYRNRWFGKNPYAYKYELKEGMQKEIDERIDDLTAVVESYMRAPCKLRKPDSAMDYKTERVTRSLNVI